MKSSGKIWIFFDQNKGKQTKPMSTTQAQMLVLSLQNRDLNRYSIWTPGWDEWIPLQMFLESEQNLFVMAPKPVVTPPPSTNSKNHSRAEKKSSEHEQSDIDEITKTLTEAIEEEDEFTVVALEVTSGGQKQDYGYFFKDFNGHELKMPNLQPKPSSKRGSNVRPSVKDESKSDRRESDRRTADRHLFKIEIILVNKVGKSLRTHSRNISLSGTLLEDELPKDFRTGDLDMVIVNKFDRDLKTGRLHFKGKVVGDLSDTRRLCFIDPEPEMIARLDALLRSYINHSQHAKKKKSA